MRNVQVKRKINSSKLSTNLSAKSVLLTLQKFMLKRISLFIITVTMSLQAFSQNWIIYNTQNSGLPANEVLSVTQDNEGNKWIGTYWGGVAKFDNQHWTVYTDTNSAMPHYTVRTVAVDGDNNKWFGTPAGVAKID